MSEATSSKKNSAPWWWTGAIAVAVAIIGKVSFDRLSVDDDDPGPRTKIHANIERTARIWSHLRAWRLDVDSRKVVLLQAHDSGGAIPTKSTVKAESMIDEAEPVLNDWHQQKLDGAYVHMLEKLILSGRLTNFTEEMERGTLKTVYQAAGVVISDVRLLGSSNETLWYVSVTFDEIPPNYDPENDNFGAVYENKMRKHLGMLRRMLRDLGEIH